MFCPNCGRNVNDTAKFCVGCGTPLGGAEQQNQPVLLTPDAEEATKESVQAVISENVTGFEEVPTAVYSPFTVDPTECINDASKKQRKTGKKSKTWFFAALFIVVGLTAWGVIFGVSEITATKRAEEQISLGEKYLSKLEYEQAIAAYKKALEIDPKNTDAYLGLADAYIAVVEFGRAENILEDAEENVKTEADTERIRQKQKEVKKKRTTGLGYIKYNGEMIMGITLFEPMNYKDSESGELTGFETEFAEAVCEKLGVKATFQMIDWKQKESDLKVKQIDCIWNALMVTEERKENMAFTVPYLCSYPVAVIRKTDARKYVSIASMAGANMVAEYYSTGQTAIEKDAVLSENKFTTSDTMKDALLAVKAGTSDIAIVDYIMAQTMLKDTSNYGDLMIIEGVKFTSMSENYAIGFRLEDVELVEAVNKAINELAKDGFLAELAEKYSISDALLLK